MPNVKVIFDRFDVNKDGDPGVTDGKGELYWKLLVNGTKVHERLSSNHLSMASGDKAEIDASKSVELDSNQELLITGYVAEKDQLGTGKDDNAPLSRSFDRSENWGDGAQSARLVDRKLDCTLYYTIQVE